ncbi:hypothetical protein SAMN02799631_04883 [Methylobacterium sp. 174MFSha1.1]|uniref:hypothetical protein n=1 Tax=Methylobacterium sp. 174MFSha1.1 TaxID=1502749 RepID=UPI0008E56753|nr:hypothetical protein [Methylobacterium sp. 174MFSha1.1]SFV09379.1 hypothetical protein SAMN02799631_04883 [Methylobacterium sp. 174MFSha1.1]
MTMLLDKAVEALRRLPPNTQDTMAQAILLLAQDDVLADIAPEHLSYILEGLAEIERGEFATDEEVEAAFRSFER